MLFDTLHNVSNENVERPQAKMAATFKRDGLGRPITPFLTPNRKATAVLFKADALAAANDWDQTELRKTQPQFIFLCSYAVVTVPWLCKTDESPLHCKKNRHITKKADCICSAAVRNNTVQIDEKPHDDPFPLAQQEASPSEHHDVKHRSTNDLRSNTAEKATSGRFKAVE